MSVKCSECGLLCIRDDYDNNVYEIIPDGRNTGYQRSSLGNSVMTKVMCYRGSPAFTEQGKIKTAGDARQAVEKISEDRDCNEFQFYQPGKSPKEHEQMTLLEKVESLNRQSQMDQRAITERQHLEVINLGQAFMALKYELQDIVDRGQKNASEKAIEWRMEDRKRSKASLYISLAAVVISVLVFFFKK